MKQLTCEMCGSTDLIKNEGVFVCQSCGTKYSVEEAKKMMIEGMVEVTGTVKVDDSARLEKSLKNARRAFSDSNYELAATYYKEVLDCEPENWEGVFYTTYCASMQCKIAQITSAANAITNCVDTVLVLIKKNSKTDDERQRSLTEMATHTMIIAEILNSSAFENFNNMDHDMQSRFFGEFVDRVCSTALLVTTLGDSIDSAFGEYDYAHKLSADAWKKSITWVHSMAQKSADKNVGKDLILETTRKVQKYDPSYPTPQFSATSSGGCYVATSIYGSYDCPQVWTLRRYRDFTLAKNIFGRAFIRIYYAVSPTIVTLFGKKKWFIKIWREVLDRKVEELRRTGAADTPYEDRQW